MSAKLDESVSAIKQLLDLFRVERMVYLIITVVSLVLLIITVVAMLWKSEEGADYMAVAGMLGSSGGIVYTAGRLLKMWSEAMQLMMKVMEKKEDE